MLWMQAQHFQVCSWRVYGLQYTVYTSNFSGKSVTELCIAIYNEDFVFFKILFVVASPVWPVTGRFSGSVTLTACQKFLR